MVRGHEVLLATNRGEITPALDVVPTIGQELHGQEGVSRAALAQIHLDGMGRPGTLRGSDDDVTGWGSFHVAELQPSTA